MTEDLEIRGIQVKRALKGREALQASQGSKGPQDSLVLKVSLPTKYVSLQSAPILYQIKLHSCHLCLYVLYD